MDKGLKREIMTIVDGRIGDRWGELIEELIEGKLIQLLNHRNIKVTSSYKNEKGSYKDGDSTVEYENDIVARNGKEVVVVEVKTHLKKDDVDNFLEKLKNKLNKIPSYKDNKIFGAVAFLKKSDSSDVYASKNGLFVIKATGDSAWILNKEEFKPQNFANN